MEKGVLFHVCSVISHIRVYLFIFGGYNKGNIFSFACCFRLCMCYTHKFCAVVLHSAPCAVIYKL